MRTQGTSLDTVPTGIVLFDQQQRKGLWGLGRLSIEATEKA
jgi:hypothetical protein